MGRHDNWASQKGNLSTSALGSGPSLGVRGGLRLPMLDPLRAWDSLGSGYIVLPQTALFIINLLFPLQTLLTSFVLSVIICFLDFKFFKKVYLFNMKQI